MSSLEIKFSSFDVHFFRPKDLDTFDHYFSASGPERPAAFFIANHCEPMRAEEFSAVPDPGDSVIIGSEEYVVRARVFTEREDGGRSSIAVLVTPPMDVADDEAS